MPSIASMIREHHEEILQRWSQEARKAASAKGISKPEFDNIMPRFVSALGAAKDIGEFSTGRRLLIENHLSSRIRQGFDLAEIIEEFAILDRAVAHIWESGAAEHPDTSDLQSFFVELNKATKLVAEAFGQHMAADEQQDKRYTRLLQQIASDALTNGGQPFSDRLEDVLKIIMEAMNAQAATLLLKTNGVESETMTTAASVGDATGVLEKYVTTPDPISFAGQVASHDEPTTLLDTLTTELQVSDVLKQNGIHSLLGVRFPPHHSAMGVLYIGLAERREFSARELQRIEMLAARLLLHLDNARVYQELREKGATLEDKIGALNRERELRERFMSVLAHDLRGPLNVVNMAAGILLDNRANVEDARHLLTKIRQNTTRIDRMIGDLLDVSRIHAHERLPLQLNDCNVSALIDELVEELRFLHPTREFARNGDNDIHGIWSVDELRRSIWNLAINAVKYGDSNKPITLSVQRSGEGAEISVHNYGTVIPVEAQASLFNPFMRSTREGQTGWGLGLTLVRGATEAHGGTVTIESTEEKGTTFTIHLPADSRPYLPAA